MFVPRIRSLLLTGSLALFACVLCACQNESASANSEPPEPSISAATVQLPSPTIAPTIPQPTATTAYSTDVIILPQPTPDTVPQAEVRLPGNKIPQALIQIVSPGSGSKLSQSFTARISVYPGDQGNVDVRLYGEDGRIIFDAHENVQVPASGWVSLAEKVDFYTLAAGETGLLTVSTCDGYGRLIALSSVRLMLLQIGPNEVEVQDFNGEPFVVVQPAVGGTVKGGLLHIEGAAHPFSSQPLRFDLVGTEGQVIASGQAALPARSEGADYVPFSLDIPYTVSGRTPVRLTLHQAADSPAGVDAALSSLLIFLDP